MPRDRYDIWRDKRGRRVCACGGYHFPHRRGGGACDHSKTCAIHRAKRLKDPEAIIDAMLEHVLEHGGETGDDKCPF
jgi:hypothetical protein